MKLVVFAAATVVVLGLSANATGSPVGPGSPPDALTGSERSTGAKPGPNQPKPIGTDHTTAPSPNELSKDKMSPLGIYPALHRLLDEYLRLTGTDGDVSKSFKAFPALLEKYLEYDPLWNTYTKGKLQETFKAFLNLHPISDATNEPSEDLKSLLDKYSAYQPQWRIYTDAKYWRLYTDEQFWKAFKAYTALLDKYSEYYPSWRTFTDERFHESFKVYLRLHPISDSQKTFFDRYLDEHPNEEDWNKKPGPGECPCHPFKTISECPLPSPQP